MRILTPEQAIGRLTSDKNVARTLYVDRSETFGGRKDTQIIDLETKAMIAAHVKAGMTCGEVGKLFGFHRAKVQHISDGNKRGAVGNVIPDQELKSVMKSVNESVAEKATNLVMAALEQVSSARLTDPKNKLRDVTGAAKDLASIVEKVSPKSEGGNIAAVVLMGTAPFSSDRYKVLETSAVVVK